MAKHWDSFLSHCIPNAWAIWMVSWLCWSGTGSYMHTQKWNTSSYSLKLIQFGFQSEVHRIATVMQHMFICQLQKCKYPFSVEGHVIVLGIFRHWDKRMCSKGGTWKRCTSFTCFSISCFSLYHAFESLPFLTNVSGILQSDSLTSIDLVTSGLTSRTLLDTRHLTPDILHAANTSNSQFFNWNTGLLMW